MVVFVIEEKSKAVEMLIQLGLTGLSRCHPRLHPHRSCAPFLGNMILTLAPNLADAITGRFSFVSPHCLQALEDDRRAAEHAATLSGAALVAQTTAQRQKQCACCPTAFLIDVLKALDCHCAAYGAPVGRADV